MSRERPIAESLSPSPSQSIIMRGIISPCTGCKNNIPVNTGDIDEVEHNIGPVCPKRILYSLKKQYGRTTGEQNYAGPIFNDKLLALNPVWPGYKDHGNAYAYVFVATYEENVDTGWNPGFDTERIICRGPYLIKGSERDWHKVGHLEQSDPVLIIQNTYFIEGQEFLGVVEEAQIWQVARGYVREIDHNLGKSLSANGSI